MSIDGMIDIVTSGDGMYDQIRVFINSGEGAFTDFTAKSGLLGRPTLRTYVDYALIMR
jgi:hypothetical protein